MVGGVEIMIKMEMTNREALVHNLIEDITHMDNEALAQLLVRNQELVGLLCDYCIKCPDSDDYGNCQENIKRWLENDN